MAHKRLELPDGHRFQIRVGQQEILGRAELEGLDHAHGDDGVGCLAERVGEGVHRAAEDERRPTISRQLV